MPRGVLAGAVVVWIGATLVLSTMRWFNRRPLVARLQPYEPGGMRHLSGSGLLSVGSFRDIITPVARVAGEGLAGLLGVHEDVAVRLRRVHAPVDATAFRMRQLGWAAVGFGAGTAIAALLRLPLVAALPTVAGGALLGFLVVEQQLATVSTRWKRRVLLELPVVSEQLGMLLGAGYSLGGALNRLAARGSGACGHDLAVVCGRIRQGLTDVAALREWAEVADVDALHRLVAVLGHNREAGDLGRLVGEEARSIRRQVQRDLTEQIERRAQQVWIPVTVATLVPGAVLLAVPFIEALRLFSST